MNDANDGTDGRTPIGTGDVVRTTTAIDDGGRPTDGAAAIPAGAIGTVVGDAGAGDVAVRFGDRVWAVAPGTIDPAGPPNDDPGAAVADPDVGDRVRARYGIVRTAYDGGRVRTFGADRGAVGTVESVRPFPPRIVVAFDDGTTFAVDAADVVGA